MSINTFGTWCFTLTRLHVLCLHQGMSINNFGTWSFHVDPIDLGTVRKTLKTPVFQLSERFLRLYNLRYPKQPSGIR